MLDDASRAAPDGVRAALHGIRALLLDMDGVLVLKGRPIDGVAEALARLSALDIPYRIVTNTSLFSRATLSRWTARLGPAIPPERIISALSVSAAYTRQRHPGGLICVLCSADALTEFEGQRLFDLSAPEDATAMADAVVIGDSADALTYENLNRAFRLVRNGAELIGMHRNPWWLTPTGPSIDSGAFVTGLEFATGRPAMILGKPSPAFFRQAADDLALEFGAHGEPRLYRGQIVMVGDDVRSDVLAARRVGLRGVLVLTGKHGPDDVEIAARARRGARPDAIAASLAEVVSWLEPAGPDR